MIKLSIKKKGLPRKLPKPVIKPKTEKRPIPEEKPAQELATPSPTVASQVSASTPEKKDLEPKPEIQQEKTTVPDVQQPTQQNIQPASTFEENLFNALKELGIIEEKKLIDAYEESKLKNSSFKELLLIHDLISDADLGKIVAEVLKVPFIELSGVKISPDLVYLIPETYARNQKVIVFEETDSEVKLAMVEPTPNSLAKQYIEQKAQRKASVFYATERDFEKALKVYKQNLQRSYDEILKEQVKNIGKKGISEAPIEQIVTTLIEYAYDNAASDIHIEPENKESIVRFRIDGIMQEVLHITSEIHNQVISRIKFLSALRTDEHLSAQDGKIHTKIENEDFDIRISIVPIVHGEKCVMRLLSARYRQFGLADLGMNEADLKKVMDASSKPFGMILSTGPTGSGKTTSIYAILKILNTKERNISTIEDPIEYEIPGLNQIQVNPNTNLTFVEGLRSILRQDPNIIYVGEIRDDETADIAINSAMTGHLVLSTLHTSNSATALPRLLDMKIEPFLVASTVNIVIAQRLIRKICDKCKLSKSAKIADLEKHFTKKQLQKYFKSTTEIRIYAGKGCPVCRNTGYSGRVGIFEILILSSKIQDLIVAKADSQKIMQQAILEGMTTMTEDGLSKVQQGVTTIGEVLRATRE